MLVLVRDAELHRLGSEARTLGLRWLELNLLASSQPMALAFRSSVDADRLGPEQPLGHTARADLRQRGEVAVQPLTRGLLRNALLHARALRVRPPSSRSIGARDNPPRARRLAVRNDQRKQQSRNTDDDEGVREIESRPVAKIEEVRHMTEAHTVEEVRDATDVHEAERDRYIRMTYSGPGDAVEYPS